MKRRNCNTFTRIGENQLEWEEYSFRIIQKRINQKDCLLIVIVITISQNKMISCFKRMMILGLKVIVRYNSKKIASHARSVILIKRCRSHISKTHHKSNKIKNLISPLKFFILLWNLCEESH